MKNEKTMLGKLEKELTICREEAEVILKKTAREEKLLQRRYDNFRFTKHGSDTEIRLHNIDRSYYNGEEKYPYMFKCMNILGREVGQRNIIKEEFMNELKSRRKFSRYRCDEKEIDIYLKELKETPYEESKTEKQYCHQYGYPDFIPIIGRTFNKKRNKIKAYENPRAYRAINKNRVSRIKSKAFDMYHSGIEWTLLAGIVICSRLYFSDFLDK